MIDSVPAYQKINALNHRTDLVLEGESIVESHCCCDKSLTTRRIWHGI